MELVKVIADGFVYDEKKYTKNLMEPFYINPLQIRFVRDVGDIPEGPISEISFEGKKTVVAFGKASTLVKRFNEALSCPSDNSGNGTKVLFRK